MTILHDDSASASASVSEITSGRDVSLALSRNEHLLRWVEKMAQLTQPAAIHWVDGSVEEERCSKRRWSPVAPSSNSMKIYGPAVTTRDQTQRRCPSRRSHLHLFALQRRRWSNQQLGRAVPDAAKT